ncbi:hypothetical protein HanIR_Chr09g0437411 [Helianthus annuus]|nr:hypothetical protein HanIR_Chr09g0437411 [Helianthus annuus]
MRAGHGGPLGMPNAWAENPAQGRRRNPNPPGVVTWAFVPKPRPNPHPIPHSLINEHKVLLNIKILT